VNLALLIVPRVLVPLIHAQRVVEILRCMGRNVWKYVLMATSFTLEDSRVNVAVRNVEPVLME
jgi:hypothetical protein